MAVQSATPLLLHYDITDGPNQPTNQSINQSHGTETFLRA